MSQVTPPQNGSNVSNGKGKNRRKIALIAFLLLGVVALAIGVPYYLYIRTHKSTDDAFITGHITSIASRVPGNVVKVLVEDNQWVQEGDVLVELDPADYQAALDRENATLRTAMARFESARTAVKLTSITAYAGLDEAGSLVKVASSASDTARTRVSTAHTRLEQADAAVKAAEAGADEARAGVAAAEAKANFDAEDLKRFEEMFKGEAITKQDLDRSHAQADISRAQLETARKKVASEEAKVTQAKAALKGAEDGLKEAESTFTESESSVKQAQAHEAGAKSAPERVSVSEAEARVAEADVARARAAVRTAELMLSYTKVRAPRPGRVTGKTVTRGVYVQTGQGLLALVPADVWVVANYKETDLTDMEPGQPVEISVDAYPDAKFTGRVDSIQSGTGASFSLLPPENASGNYIKVVQRVPVKIVFDPAPDPAKYLLAPGMSVVPTVNVSVRGKGFEKPPVKAAAHGAPSS